MAAAVLMMASLLTMPALLGAVARTFGLPIADLGLLALVETLAYVTGIFLASGTPVARLRTQVLIAGACVAVANLGCLAAGSRDALLLLRPVVGLGSGMAFGYALKHCSGSARPDRSFGILTAALSMMMVGGFQAIGAIDAAVGGRSVFVLYAVLAGLAMAIAWSTPAAPERAGEGAAGAAGMPAPVVLLGLAGIILSFLAQGSLWAFLERLGSAHGFAARQVTNALSMFAIAGIGGSLGAAALPARVPRSSALITAMGVLIPGLYMLYAPPSLAGFVLGCAVGGFYWNFTLSLQLGILAKVDPSGRGAVLGGMVSGIGSALGPMIAGALVQGSDFRPVGWMAGSLVAAATVFILIVNRARSPALPAAA